MPETPDDSHSHLRVLAAVIAVVLAVAATAWTAGLASRKTGGGLGRGTGSIAATLTAPPGTPVGGPSGPPGAAALPVSRLRAELDTYLDEHGNVAAYEILRLGPDGLPKGSRFAARIAPDTQFLARHGKQRPPVYAEVIVTREDGTRFAAFMEYADRADGPAGWSDLLTLAVP